MQNKVLNIDGVKVKLQVRTEPDNLQVSEQQNPVLAEAATSLVVNNLSICLSDLPQFSIYCDIFFKKTKTFNKNCKKVGKVSDRN